MCPVAFAARNEPSTIHCDAEGSLKSVSFLIHSASGESLNFSKLESKMDAMDQNMMEIQTILRDLRETVQAFDHAESALRNDLISQAHRFQKEVEDKEHTNRKLLSRLNPSALL